MGTKAIAKEANQELVGQKIVAIRKLTKKELKDEGWEVGRFGLPLVIVLEDGSKLYASQDEEGNGPGVLFGRLGDGTSIYVQEER